MPVDAPNDLVRELPDSFVCGPPHHHPCRADHAAVEKQATKGHSIAVDRVFVEKPLERTRLTALADVLHGAVDETYILVRVERRNRALEVAGQQLIIGVEEDHVLATGEL